MSGRASIRLLSLACVVTAAASWAGPVAAHVGSPDTWFEGNAGSYPIRMVVRARQAWYPAWRRSTCVC